MLVLSFHSSVLATQMCVCSVCDDGRFGYDAFGCKYKVGTDDFGNQYFWRNEQYKAGKLVSIF